MALKTKNNYKKKNSWLQKNKRLALFVATFAAIGGFFLWRSFAGTALSISMDACANGKGYYIAQIDGTVTAFGDAEKKIGSPSSDRTKLNQGVVDIASTPDCKGYWIMTGAGRVLAYGNASFKGQITEDAPEGFYVALVPTSTGQGYWIVNKLGGVTAKGDAEGKIDFKQTNYKVAFGGIAGVNEIVDADVATSDKGLYLLDKNGKVYTAGDAERRDDVTLRPGEIATSISAYNMNRSYYVATSKGKVFAFGSGAKQKGDRDGDAINGIITSLVYRGTPGTDDVGYWMLDGGGKIYAHGNVKHLGGTGDVKPVIFVDPCAGQDLKDVQKLQRCLNWKGAKPTLVVDGVFGPQTREACQQIFKNYCPYADPAPVVANPGGSGLTGSGGSESGPQRPRTGENGGSQTNPPADTRCSDYGRALLSGRYTYAAYYRRAEFIEENTFNDWEIEQISIKLNRADSLMDLSENDVRYSWGVPQGHKCGANGYNSAVLNLLQAANVLREVKGLLERMRV